MKLLPILSVGIAAAGLLSCATPYQEIGTNAAGGHSFVRKAEDVFVVTFMGNGFTDPTRASDFAKLRAADVTLEHNFRYFSIIGQQDQSSTEIVNMGSNSYTTGSVNSFGGFNATTTTYQNRVPIHKPGKSVGIRCYTKQPGGHAGLVYDAAQVRSELRLKYRLDKPQTR